MPSFTATIRKLVRSPEPTYTPLTPSASWHDSFHKWALIEVPSEVPGTPSTTEFAHWPAKKSKVRRSTPTRVPVEISETSAEDASTISLEISSAMAHANNHGLLVINPANRTASPVRRAAIRRQPNMI